MGSLIEIANPLTILFDGSGHVHRHSPQAASHINNSGTGPSDVRSHVIASQCCTSSEVGSAVSKDQALILCRASKSEVRRRLVHKRSGTTELCCLLGVALVNLSLSRDLDYVSFFKRTK
jgi:hypothetical protein